jgi:hypothetical protein
MLLPTLAQAHEFGHTLDADNIKCVFPSIFGTEALQGFVESMNRQRTGTSFSERQNKEDLCGGVVQG